MSANNKFIGGAFLQKELQGFSGFLAYQECFRRGTSSTKGTLEASLGEQFFGNPSDVDSIGLAEQLVKGVGVFAGLYTVEEPDTMPLLVTDVRANQSPLPILVLKPELHCLGGDKRVVVGAPNGINLSLLYSRSLRSTASQNTTIGAPATTMLANRTIPCRAQDHLKNGKKALAIVLASDSPYKAYASNGTLPSGMSLQDYYMYIRRKMYTLLLNNSGSFVDSNSSTNDELPSVLGTTEDHGTDDLIQESHDRIRDVGEASEDAMPENWTFPGFVIFALLGPIVPDGMAAYRSELFMTSPQVNVESNATPNYGTPAGGRNSARKQATADASNRRRAKDKSNHQHNSSTSSSTEIHSGITLDQRIHVAAIAQSRMANLGKERSRIHDRILSRHRQKVKDMKSLISGHKFLILET